MKWPSLMLIVGLLTLCGVHPLAQEKPSTSQLKPAGPDELFTALPPATYEGKAPTDFRKYIILHVPNRGSWNDMPAEDLSGSERVVAGGFELMLQQQLEYRPYFHAESSTARLARYHPMLRNADVPRVGSGDCLGKRYAALDKALDTYAAHTVFLLGFVPGAKDAPAQGAAYSYSRDGGVLTCAEWQFPKLGKPDSDSAIRVLEEQVAKLIGPQGSADADGNWQEFPFAPVPQLTASDDSLRDYVAMRDAFHSGQLSTALINYESLMKKDPTCGRAALFGMEIYRAVAETQTDMAEHTRYRDGAMRIGRDALRNVPNDVLLRGRLSWTAGTHYNRVEFAQAGLKEAMRVHPANPELFLWWTGVYEVENRPRQVQWLKDNALALVRDGRIEYQIGTILYTSGDYAGGVEWYRKAIALSPLEHEWHRSLGLCGTYLAESSFRKMDKDAALDAWIEATAAFATAQDIDPRDVRWVYEYYPRVATRDYSHIPVGEAEQERLFLTQAVVTGLEPNSRTWEWERLTKDLLPVMKRNLRETCKEAKPGDDLYETKLMARLQFAVTATDTDEIILCLWTMHEIGLRTDNYRELMYRFGPVVREYEPRKEDDSGDK